MDTYTFDTKEELDMMLEVLKTHNHANIFSTTYVNGGYNLEYYSDLLGWMFVTCALKDMMLPN